MWSNKDIPHQVLQQQGMPRWLSSIQCQQNDHNVTHALIDCSPIIENNIPFTNAIVVYDRDENDERSTGVINWWSRKCSVVINDIYIVEFSVCKDLYCRNGGKCSGPNTAWCTCPPGYTGAFCHKSKYSGFTEHKQTIKEIAFKVIERVYLSLWCDKEVSGLIGIMFNNDILSDIFLLSLKLNVRKTRVKMAVHVLAKTSVLKYNRLQRCSIDQRDSLLLKPLNIISDTFKHVFTGGIYLYV